MTEVLEIFSSGKLTLKTRSTSPFGGSELVPLIVAVDDGHMAFELDMEWRQLFQAEGSGYIRSMFMSWIAQLIFGKKMRFIAKTDGMAIAFPDKKMYLPMTAPDGELLEFDLAGALSEVFGGVKNTEDIEARLNEIKSSKVTLGGKEYLCAEVATRNADDTTTVIRYYFLDGNLKRIEANAEGESVTWEIDMLSSQVDPAFFSTAGMRTMPLLSLLPLLPLLPIGNLF